MDVLACLLHTYVWKVLKFDFCHTLKMCKDISKPIRHNYVFKIFICSRKNNFPLISWINLWKVKTHWRSNFVKYHTSLRCSRRLETCFESWPYSGLHSPPPNEDTCLSSWQSKQMYQSGSHQHIYMNHLYSDDSDDNNVDDKDDRSDNDANRRWWQQLTTSMRQQAADWMMMGAKTTTIGQQVRSTRR